MIKPDELILVMGRRGCGKSYLAKKIQEIWPRRIIIDSLNEYTDGIIVNSFSEFCDKLIILKEKNIRKFVLIFKFNPEEGSSTEVFDQILRISYYFGDVQIVIEEIQRYSSPHFLSKWLENCLFVGRHQKISMLFTTQRPGMLNKGILSQCAHVFCGQLIDKNDINYVSGFLGDKSRELTTLPQRRFIYRTDSEVKIISNDI